MLHNAFPALGTNDGWGGGACSAGDVHVTHRSSMGPFWPPKFKSVAENCLVNRKGLPHLLSPGLQVTASFL